MPIIKPSTAFKQSADWVSAEVRAYMKDQVSTHVDTVQDVRDNDFEKSRFIFVKSLAATFRLDLSSGADDDGVNVLHDNIGRRYLKVIGTGLGGVDFDAQVADLAGRAAYDDEAEGFKVLVSDVGDGRAAIYSKDSGASADWSDPAYVTGPQGSTGDIGGVAFQFDDGTADADPGAGNIRANNADLSAATTLFVSKANRYANSVAAYLATLDDSTSSHKGYLTLTAPDSETQATFSITGLTDASGYVKLTVSGHSGATSFVDAERLVFQFSRTGNAGDLNGVTPGPTGLELLEAETERDARATIKAIVGVDPYMFGAIGDGVADDLTPLNDMFAYAAANGVPAWITAGTFACIAGSPVVPSNVTVFGIAGGTIIQKTLPNTNPLSASDPGDGEFSGLHINRESENITIDGVRLRGPYGDITEGVSLGRIVVNNGGSGYSSAPTVVITGGGGTGATATANLAGDVVTSVSVTDGGTGYTSRPTISFTGGGGSGATAYATTIETRYRSIGIAISGRYDQYFYENPNYPGNPSDPLAAFSSNIFIRNCDIEGFGQSGILADHIRNFEAINNRISRCGRDGIRMYGVNRFKVIGNDVAEMAPGFLGEGSYPNNNVYGIEATRIYHSTNGDGDTTDYPPPRDGIVAGNTVLNCWSWKSMGSHGGANIGFYNNMCRDSYIGIGIDKGGYNLADGYAPPTDIKEDGNTFEITSSFPLTPRIGIFLTANDGTDDNIGLNNTIGSSTIIGYGRDNAEGAIYVGNQRSVAVKHPIIRDSLRAAIVLRGTIDGITLDAATIEGVRESSLGICTGISVESATVRGTIGPCSFRQDSADTLTGVTVISPDSGYGVKVSDAHTISGSVNLLPSPGNVRGGGFGLVPRAWANINNGGSASISSGLGIASVSRIAAGQVRVTFREAFSTTGTAAVWAIAKGNAARYAAINAVSTTEFDVYIRDSAGTLTDTGFYVGAMGY